MVWFVFRFSAVFALCAALPAISAAAAAPVGPLSVGIEPARPAPGSGAGIVFVDALKQAAPWSSSQALRLDADGNVTSLRPGQVAESAVYANERYPAGDYTLLYDGHGTFDFDGASVVAQTPGRAVVRVAPNAGAGLHLRLLATDPADYARNVRLILPGFEKSYVSEPFHPAFLRTLAGRDVIRFAGWTQPDAAVTSVWPGRPGVDRFTQAMPGGVAPEYEIALANLTGEAPWFTLPVGATNLYVSQFAQLVHRTLDPRLSAIFQYGDAVWQSGTPGNAWAISAGHNYGLASDSREAALDWYVTRSIQVFDLVQRAFGNDAARVTRVVAGPAADAAGIDLDRTLLARFAGRADAFAFAARTDPASDATSVVLAHAQRLLPVELGGGDTASFAAWHGAGGALWLGTPSAGVVDAAHAAWTPRGPVRIAAYRAPLAFHHPPAHGPVLPVFVKPRDVPPPSGPAVEVTVGTPPERIDLASEGNEDWVDWSAPARAHRALRGDRSIGTGGALALEAPADPTTRILRVYVRANAARPALRATLSDGSAPAAEAVFESRFGRSTAVYTISYRARTRGARLHVALAPGTPAGSVALQAAALDSEAMPATLPAPADVTTYHNDLSRSGWDNDEYYLNERTVMSSAFGLKQTIDVAGDVLAQPLYLAGYNLGTKLGVHNLLIVATEHDVLYEFDADSGALLQSLTIGTPQKSSDVGCGDIEPEYGITSTPVIDRAGGTIYLVAATEPTTGNFQAALYAVDLATLKVKGAPTVISATANLSGGGTISFNPAAQQNRTGLVLNNGTIYVGIGSHCDFDFGSITGWMLAYNTSLKQTAAIAMGEDTNSGLLNSIWMTGFASAVDGSGNLFAVTGNGTYDGNTPGGTNFGESAVKIAPDLSSILSSFTPKEYATLDGGDTDFGSGGIILLPPSAGTYPHMAVAMGKSGVMYLLNTDALGGLGHFIQHYNVNPGSGVWGGPAFYNGPLGRFVYYQTNGQGLSVYQQTVDSKGTPHLYLESARGASGGGYGGSLPIGSSWGQKPLTGVLWLVQRNSTLRLEAYSARESTRLLFAGDAGTWSNPHNNGFVTPLVANGRVYVPAEGTISVFGLH